VNAKGDHTAHSFQTKSAASNGAEARSCDRAGVRDACWRTSWRHRSKQSVAPLALLGARMQPGARLERSWPGVSDSGSARASLRSGDRDQVSDSSPVAAFCTLQLSGALASDGWNSGVPATDPQDAEGPRICGPEQTGERQGRWVRVARPRAEGATSAGARLLSRSGASWYWLTTRSLIAPAIAPRWQSRRGPLLSARSGSDDLF
jgi:hypothetical protein